ncbi:hypothetical protein L195_g037861 [Trifolium pratense]|uniref:Uncharacterized protein n=1 Tax=Trifolium pratense TaxID=57577 RepID=A0A2K3LTH8_TRIPR|nr:hypothetical protein L195_g037861 [Trifolium pratense]
MVEIVFSAFLHRGMGVIRDDRLIVSCPTVLHLSICMLLSVASAKPHLFASSSVLSRMSSIKGSKTRNDSVHTYVVYKAKEYKLGLTELTNSDTNYVTR